MLTLQTCEITSQVKSHPFESKTQSGHHFHSNHSSMTILQESVRTPSQNASGNNKIKGLGGKTQCRHRTHVIILVKARKNRSRTTASGWGSAPKKNANLPQLNLNSLMEKFLIPNPTLEHLDLWDCSCGVQSSQPSPKISLATRLNHYLLPLPQNEFATENRVLLEFFLARRGFPRGAWAEQKSYVSWFTLDS